jgi:hypothetical protein
MDQDLTVNTIVFKKSFDEKDGSERRSTARGINTPDLLTIRSQDYIDQATKLPGRRYTCRLDRTDIDGSGVSYTSSAYFVFAVPSVENSADLTTLVASFQLMVADTALVLAVLNNEK